MTDFTHKVGTQLSFADHAGDFAPATASSLEQGTPTDVQLSLASVSDDAARQSAKFDLGANRAALYQLQAAIEIAATPTAGEVIEFYIGWSDDATAANGNPGGLSGSDAAYSGYSSNLDASLLQLDRVGTMVVTAQATGTVQIATNLGLVVPRARYGTLVVVNRSGAALHSDDVESHVVLTPIVDTDGA